MNYRKYKDSRWVETGELCERDGKKIYVEVLECGTKTEHYCCERYGCSKQEYRNIEHLIPTRNELKRY
jgi:hypothetical protein